MIDTTLSFDQFVVLCKAAQKAVNVEDVWDLRDTHFSATWLVAGVTGGSCWSDGGHVPLEADEPQEQLDLMHLLEHDFDVRLSTFSKVQAKIMTFRESDSGYYGNYTTYMVKKVSFRDVYDVLVADGCILDPATAAAT